MRISGGTGYPHSAKSVPSHLNRASKFRELFLAGEQGYFKPRIYLERIRFLLGIHPLVGPSALFGDGQGWYVGVVDDRARVFSVDQTMNALVPVGSHEIEISHGRKKVEVSVTSAPSSRVIKGVKRPITIEMLGILFNHGGPHVFVHGRRFFPDKPFVKNASEMKIPFLVEMTSVYGQRIRALVHESLGSMKAIDESDLFPFGNSGHCLDVRLKSGVIQVSGRNAFDVFVGNG